MLIWLAFFEPLVELVSHEFKRGVVQLAGSRHALEIAEFACVARGALFIGFRPCRDFVAVRTHIYHFFSLLQLFAACASRAISSSCACAVPAWMFEKENAFGACCPNL